MSRSYDYILVGGGSAACVMAGRLVAAGASVLMLERGPARTNPIMDFPAGYMKFLAKDTYLVMHPTAPQERLGGRAPIVPQGRVLGGGGAVNAMVYMRGQVEDYADWNRAIGGGGAGDWDWNDLLPHFVKQEDNDHLGGPLHGVSGPLKVSHLAHTSPMTRAYLKTLQEMGVPYTPDFNDGDPRGVGLMQHTIDWRSRRRSSPVRAFLDPVRLSPKFDLRTGATVTELIFDGTRATGVRWDSGGRTEEARAGEVLLAAGAYQTPKLLMLAGIGPAAHLAEHGIATRVDRPGVGANLQDHYECPVVATTKGAFGYYGQDRGLPMLLAGLQYLLFRSGPVTTTGVESCAFLDPTGRGGRPTIQMFCVPTVYLDRDVLGADPGHGVTINSLLLQPRSRGSVRLRSANPGDLPIVDPQIFAEPADLEVTMQGFDVARSVLAHGPLREMIDREIFPGPAITSPEAIADHCRRTVKTGYHPVGTCRMGTEADPMAVLDARLRVIGAEGLRVIDASMMPNIISGNTNAAVLAVADKAADLILERHPVKITALKTFLVPPRWLFLKIETDEGIHGWGEPVVEGRAATVETAVAELADYLVGRDPLRIEDLWTVMYRGGFYRGGPILMSAIAGVDQALWDIKGKAYGQPVHQLLGGPCRDSIRVYSWVGGDRPQDVAAAAREGVARGFTALKMNGAEDMQIVDSHAKIDAVVANVGAVRAAIGPHIGLGVDFHGRVHRPMAKALIRELEPFRLMFIEEPLLSEHIEAIGEVTRGSTTPIALGERLYSRWDFRRVLESRLVDIIQPDLSHAGGITECRKIAAMAEAYDVALAPHCPLGPIALAACLQVDAVSYNAFIQEQSLGIHYNGAGRDLLDYLVDPSVFAYADGMVAIPTGPGLGVEVNEAKVIEAAETGHRWRNPLWRHADGSVAEW